MLCFLMHQSENAGHKGKQSIDEWKEEQKELEINLHTMMLPPNLTLQQPVLCCHRTDKTGQIQQSSHFHERVSIPSSSHLSRLKTQIQRPQYYRTPGYSKARAPRFLGCCRIYNVNEGCSPVAQSESGCLTEAETRVQS